MSSTHSPSDPNTGPATAAANDPAPSVPAPAAALPPGMVSVLCPVGFTSYATEGLAEVKPLYARVTYRPA